MTIVLQQAINGIVLGNLYVLVALGLTLVYGVLVQINFAHADIVTIGAFSAYFFIHAVGGGYIASIAVALLVGGALGWLMNAAIFAPLQRRGNELLAADRDHRRLDHHRERAPRLGRPDPLRVRIRPTATT